MSEHPVDDIILPLGFEVTKKSRHTRWYQKTVDGRRVIIKYQRKTQSVDPTGETTSARSYAGSSFWLFVDTPKLQTRVRMSNKQTGAKPLGGKLKQVPAEGDYTDRHVYALDPDWTQTLIHHHEAKPLILSLTSLTEEVAPPPALQIQPLNILSMGSIPHEALLTQEYVKRRVDEMLKLAEIAEGLPQTYTPVKQTGGERSVIEGASPLRILMWLVIIFVVLAIPALICMGIALVMSTAQ